MDDWIKTIVGGLIGGGIAAIISWVKYRDDRRDRLREAYLALFGSIERLRTSMAYVEMHQGNLNVGPESPVERISAMAGEVKVASARAEFLESSESCLARLAALKDAVTAFHSAMVLGLEELEQGTVLDADTVQLHTKTRDDADTALKDAGKALMLEAKNSIDRI